MLRPSFVPPPAIRALRDLTRTRVHLLTTCTAGKQQVAKLLMDDSHVLVPWLRSGDAPVTRAGHPVLDGHTSISPVHRPGCKTAVELTDFDPMILTAL